MLAKVSQNVVPALARKHDVEKNDIVRFQDSGLIAAFTVPFDIQVVTLIAQTIAKGYNQTLLVFDH
jgi:hypothetical protein